MQLTIKGGLKAAGYLNKPTAKASSIVSHCRKSTLAQDVSAGEDRLQPAAVTRWNSQVKMIHSVLKADETKLDQLSLTKLSVHERNILSEVVGIFAPFEVATDCVQGSYIVTASYITPVHQRTS